MQWLQIVAMKLCYPIWGQENPTPVSGSIASLNIPNKFIWFSWIEPCHSPIIASSCTHGNPYMLVRHLDIDKFSVAIPSQTAFWSHVTVPLATIFDPFSYNKSYKVNFLPEIISCRNALDHRIDFSTPAARSLCGSRGLGHEIKQRLQWIRKLLSIIKCSRRQSSLNREISCSLDRKMVEITPSAICGDDNFRVVREVELCLC
jgi:hypothetical protein